MPSKKNRWTRAEREEIANKIDWEGGIIAILDYDPNFYRGTPVEEAAKAVVEAKTRLELEVSNFLGNESLW